MTIDTRRPDGSEGRPGATAGASLDDGESIRRNTAFAFAIQLATAVFTAAVMVFLVRALGPSRYGVFALAAGIAGLLFLPSDFGISQSAARFIAERRGRRAEVAEVLATALRLKLLAGAAVCGGLALAAGPIASAYDQPGVAWPLRAMALALFGQSVMTLYHYSFVAVGRVSVGLRLVLSKSVAEAGATVALVVIGMGALGAALGRATGFGLGGLLALVLAARMFGRRSLDITARGGGARRIAGYAGALLVVDAAYTALSQMDVLLIGAYLGATAVGLFEPIVRLVAFLHYPGLAVANGVAPRLARHERLSPSVRAFEQALRGLLILQAAVVAGVVAWAEPAVHLVLGPRYGASAEVLRALAPFIFLSGVAPLVSLGVNYLGEARWRIPIAVGAVVINAAINVALIPSIGILAGAIATDAAYLLYVPAHFLICRRMLGIKLRPLGLTLVRSLAAAATMSLVLAAVGTSKLSPVEWVGGAMTGLAAFVAMLLLTREVSPRDMRRGWRAVGARLPRRAP